jgi:hypothetical protein
MVDSDPKPAFTGKEDTKCYSKSQLIYTEVASALRGMSLIEISLAKEDS